jgi:hypothetical protein
MYHSLGDLIHFRISGRIHTGKIVRIVYVNGVRKYEVLCEGERFGVRERFLVSDDETLDMFL